MRRLAPILFLAALPAIASPAGDAHLPAVPRTAAEAAEAARLAAAALAPDSLPPEALMPGGAATVPLRKGTDAFSQPSANLLFAREEDFVAGNALFRRSFTPDEGLGPLFNAPSCETCHRRDGRGVPADAAGGGFLSMVLRLPPGASEGSQLQDRAVPGATPEGSVSVRWEELPVRLGDGTVVMLRRPLHAAVTPDGASLPAAPRVAPQLIGLGLIEAIPADDILARADPDDADGDGISGRAAIVPSRELGVPLIGRFGHKAAVPTIREQVAAALHADMGLSSPVMPGLGTAPEVDAEAFDILAFYTRNLAVPAARPPDAAAARGRGLFLGLGCGACHTPAHLTHRLDGQPEQSAQAIWPYTDLLLHDMGEGLADPFAEAGAEGAAGAREWRTAPLWGIGLTAQVSGQMFFLHDGRARTLTEAILWHGGEAQAARDGFAALSAGDRAAVLAFVEGL